MPRILIIDDKEDNLISASAIVKLYVPDSVVETALSGPDGVEKAQNTLPDVILLDVRMPGMDGFEVCRRLKADDSTIHIPVIMLTAIDFDTRSRVKGLDTGADLFLHKPIDEVELAAQIKVMLRIKKTEDELRRERDAANVVAKHSRHALAESEQRLRLALANSNIVVYTTDIDLRYTWIYNPFPGTDRWQILGKTDHELMAAADADPLMQLKKTVIDTGKAVERTITLNTGQAATEWARNSVKHNCRRRGRPRTFSAAF